jgi:acyl transferase domain-containing protein
MKASHGNFLSDPFQFDHEYFGISPREAKSMDPQQKLLLQGAVHAMDDAGYVPNGAPSFNPETMGCYIGVATDDYVQNLSRQIDVYYSTGTVPLLVGSDNVINRARDPARLLEREDILRVWLERTIHCY